MYIQFRRLLIEAIGCAKCDDHTVMTTPLSDDFIQRDTESDICILFTVRGLGTLEPFLNYTLLR